MITTKRAVLGTFAPLLGAVAAGQTPLERPNILCIVCEDISPYLGCYGDPNASTPNLDRFASQAVRYTEMHSTVGVSAPSRFGLITGMLPSACGADNMRVEGYEVVTPPRVRCVSELMRRAGYYCTNGPKTDYQFGAPLSAWDECGGKDFHWKHRPEGMPFFSIFNLKVTHEGQMWTRAGLPLTTSPDSLVLPPYLPDTPTVRRDMAVLYSNISEMDRQSQALLDELDEAGVAENTVVIWYSDNGGPIPRGKREIYLTGTRVPFMIRYPDGWGAGTVDDGIHQFQDIPATILSLAGIRTPGYMYGRAFAGRFARGPRRYAFSARDRMGEGVDKQGGVFDGRYQLIRNYMPERADFLDIAFQNRLPMVREMKRLYEEGKLDGAQAKWFEAPRAEWELYDTFADPFELDNRAEDPSLAGVRKRLERAYGRWIRRYNRDWFTPEEELRGRFFPGGEQQATAAPVLTVRGARAHGEASGAMGGGAPGRAGDEAMGESQDGDAPSKARAQGEASGAMGGGAPGRAGDEAMGEAQDGEAPRKARAQGTPGGLRPEASGGARLRGGRSGWRPGAPGDEARLRGGRNGWRPGARSGEARIRGGRNGWRPGESGEARLHGGRSGWRPGARSGDCRVIARYRTKGSSIVYRILPAPSPAAPSTCPPIEAATSICPPATTAAAPSTFPPGPAAPWRLYTGPVSVPTGATIEFKACRIGFKDSPAVTYTAD